MYGIDVGCSLKGSTASTIIVAWSQRLHLIYDFSQLSQIWETSAVAMCKGAAIHPSTTVYDVQTPTVYDVQTPHLCMAWMWDAV